MTTGDSDQGLQSPGTEFLDGHALTGAAPVDVLDQALLLRTLVAVRSGDFSVRMPVDHTGVAGKIADTLNGIIELNARLTDELNRVSQAVGKEGKANQRASLGEARGSWSGCLDSVNGLIEDLVRPTGELARVIAAVAQGNLSQRVSL